MDDCKRRSIGATGQRLLQRGSMPLLVTRTSLISMTLNVLRFFFVNFRHRIVCSTMSVQKLIRLRFQGLGVSMLCSLIEHRHEPKKQGCPGMPLKGLSVKSEP